MAIVIDKRTLRLRPQFRHYVVPDDGVFLMAGRESYVLRGKLYEELIPMLDGGAPGAGLAELVARGTNPADIYYALDTLRRQGYIEEHSDPLPSEQAAFWQLAGVDSSRASRRFQDAPVRTLAIGGLNAEPLIGLLCSSGVRVDNGAKCWVVLTPDYLHPELEEVAAQASRAEAAWLLSKPVGVDLWIGPVFHNGARGCWQCMAHRLRGHRKVESYVARKSGPICTRATNVPQLPAAVHASLGVVAAHTAWWVAGGSLAELESSIVTMDILGLRQTRHAITRRPQCPACGDPGYVASLQWKPVGLISRSKCEIAGGGHRICSPEQTVGKLEHHISPITGLAGALRSDSSRGVGSELVQSYAVERICGRRDFEAGGSSRERRAGGKGVRAAQAQASALSEAIERYSGEFQGDEARVQASYRGLGAQAIHPNAHMLYSETQYSQRDSRNRADVGPEQIPEPFDECAEIEWTPLWPVPGGAVRYLPTACCFYDAGGAGARFAAADSNGAAAGNCKEEAILQGFLELVERDAVALWWYNRVRRPAVDLTSLDDPYFSALCEYYGSIRRDLWVLDITTDLGIPAFAAVSSRNDKEVADILIGFGAHLDPRLAIQRALTEVNQSLPAVAAVATNTPDAYRGHNAAAIEWWKTATLATESYLATDPAQDAVTCSSYPYTPSADLYDDVLHCANIAAAHGLEMLVLDQTRPDTGLDVVKVIVPGLRHFRPRFAAGRLYDVPVQLKWTAHATPEHELNRHSVYF